MSQLDGMIRAGETVHVSAPGATSPGALSSAVSRWGPGSAWQKDGVDDVDDPVRGHDIGGGDGGGMVQHHAMTLTIGADIAALNGRDAAALAEDGGGRVVGARHVVGQHIGQGRNVMQQPIQHAMGQMLEGAVRGGEDGEIAGSGQRVDKARRLNGGDQRGQVGRCDGEVDDGRGLCGKDRGAGQRCGGGPCGGGEELTAVQGSVLS